MRSLELLQKEIRKLEKRYDKTSEKAVLDRKRIEKKMAVLLKKEGELKKLYRTEEKEAA